MKWLALAFLLVVAACGGPSTAEVKTAKLAQYALPPATLFDVAIQVAQQDYKIGENDAATGQFMTVPQMYSANGGRQSAGAGGVVQYSGGSLLVALIVEIQPIDEGHTMVVVTPKTFQAVSGSPKPRELAPDDPSLPGWVLGRADALAVAIYEAAKQHVAR
jgi:hypothetical protein